MQRVDVSGHVDVRDLAARVHAGVGAARDRRSDGGVGSRSTVTSADSTSPCTVRKPGCRAQPENAVPS